MVTQSLTTPPDPDPGVSAQQDQNTRRSNFGEQSGAQAQRSFLQLSATCYLIAEEIARRCDSRLPGLSKLFSDRVLLVVGGQRSGALGKYDPERWAYDEQSFDEIHVNVGHDLYAKSTTAIVALDIVDTICHELVHLYAKANNIRDTSGRGNRYHNKRFAELAQRIELRVERSGRSHIGFQTTGFTERGIEIYADLIDRVERELRLLPNYVPPAPMGVDEPAAAPGAGTEAEVRKYVFAQCGCQNEQGRKRTIRTARGWWRNGTISCGICHQLFMESPPERTKGAVPS